jgi:transcriptional regulator with XRE-family HTH domain
MPALSFYQRQITVSRPTHKTIKISEFGGAIKKRRIELGWLQRDLADALGTCIETVIGWEKHGRAPMARHLPFLIKWLGFDPSPPNLTLGGAVRDRRRSMGMTQESLGNLLSLDPATIATVERNKGVGQRVRATIEVWLAHPSAGGRAG